MSSAKANKLLKCFKSVFLFKVPSYLLFVIFLLVILIICVLSASLHEIIFRKCYHIRHQKQYLMRTIYEELTKIQITGTACPGTQAF